MANAKKVLKDIVIGSCMTTLSFFGMYHGVNYLTREGPYEDDAFKTVVLEEDMFRKAVIGQYKDRIQTNFFWKDKFEDDVGVTYIDGGEYGAHDGEVDYLLYFYGRDSGGSMILKEFFRDKHFDDEMDKFDTADQELKKAKQKLDGRLFY